MAYISGTKAILRKLNAVDVTEISGVCGLEGDIMKLRCNLEMIQAVINDAERKQEYDLAVRLWLRWVKDVVYDADDVLDEFSYEAMRRRSLTSQAKVRDFFSSSNQVIFRLKMAHKIKDINYRLDELTLRMSMLHLQTRDYESNNNFTNESMARFTSSFIDSDDVVGRKNEKSEIIDLLIRPSISSSSSNNYALQEDIKLAVLPVVGVGGLGKTALAQLVYNDESIRKHFELQIWVCVSDDFDVERILLLIMESITQTKVDSLWNIDRLVNRVKEQLRDKKFLLVLDDLWNEDPLQWEILKDALMVGSEGSKILVTTRSASVASIVQGFIFPPYNLRHLSVNECWSIIKKRAFSPGKFDGTLESPETVDIGREIARKCRGLPLLARFLGSLMPIKNREIDWLAIRDADYVDSHSKLIPIMKLSYDHLPSDLKQCFSYCSIFPRGWEFDREALIQLWMAEGFLLAPPVSGRGYSAEDIGNDYFLRLVSESLFEIVEKDEFGYIQKCKMNDLVYGLAQAVSDRDECSILEAKEEFNHSQFRRVHLVSDEDTLNVFLKGDSVKKLRTFIATEVGNYGRIESVLYIRNLRVLYMSGSSIQYIPDSISKLIHLRYLNLSDSYNLEVLHDQAFNRLYNLQTLVLHNCSGLSRLPEDFGSMKYLRHLDLSCTGIEVLPTSLTSLFDLRTLDISYCHNLERLPEDIGALKELRSLDVSHTKVRELPQSINSLINLVELRLHSCPNLKELPW